MCNIGYDYHNALLGVVVTHGGSVFMQVGFKSFGCVCVFD